MLVPRTARPSAQEPPVSSIDDKVDGPAAKVQVMSQEGCSHAWAHAEPAHVQKPRMSLGIGRHDADCTSVPSADWGLMPPTTTGVPADSGVQPGTGVAQPASRASSCGHAHT